MQNARIGKATHATLANVKTNAKKPTISPSIVPKAVARIRQDIKSWNRALQMTKLEDNPKWYLFHQLLDEIGLDALLTSQYKNRLLKAVKEPILLKKKGGTDIDQEQTDLLNNATFTNAINTYILDSKYKKHSLIEFSFNEEGALKVNLIPRTNVDPRFGAVYPDYTEDKKILYRDTSEYGTWLLEFGEDETEYGLFNNAVPHVLFKRFAQSCWSELCEIYGIPPRYMKTNTQDPTMVKRAEKMMTDMGAAAWFIIDESESFEFAKGVSTSGDVYKNLITLCNNELSLLISGAVIGQDTQNGSRSKDESAQDMLQTLIDSDLQYLEQQWNTKVIPALVKLGVLKGDLVYEYEQTEDLEQLWKMTYEASQNYEIDTEWITEKFGIKVLGKKEIPNQNNLNLGLDFFD
ncbi:phage portal protein family protein [Pseudotamlana carrageenivorans]|uniref:DUF935 domain-containing protein n=1 Tax=Pseudotamlana carrageenivorans TaxID=2069432 RepID=A0A2I7SF27_9FLAO|nr:DUF935 family protein [Tamlana carrageenivorans]AUS04498.1 hypothetical protein C1A40_02975 [Tamlana carrageenivorans]